jgi:hypothetical protein
MLRDCAEEERDIVRVVLAVRIQGDGIVRCFKSKGKSLEKSGSFTLVLIVTENGHLREGGKDLRR